MLQSEISLEDRMKNWRENSKFEKKLFRTSSLPALSEEEDEHDSISLKSKRRSKSIDSSYID